MTSLLHALEGLSTIATETFEVTLIRVEKQLAQIVESTDHTLLVAVSGERLAGYIHTHWHPTLLHTDGEGYVSRAFCPS